MSLFIGVSEMIFYYPNLVSLDPTEIKSYPFDGVLTVYLVLLFNNDIPLATSFKLLLELYVRLSPGPAPLENLRLFKSIPNALASELDSPQIYLS